MTIYVGCDLGDTNIKAGLVNIKTGEVLVSKSTPTLAHEGHQVVIQRIAELINTIIDESSHPRSEQLGVFFQTGYPA